MEKIFEEYGMYIFIFLLISAIIGFLNELLQAVTMV